MRALAILLLCFTGCSVNQQFVRAVDATWQAIGPEYTEYLQEDETLTDSQKELRQRTARMFTQLIDEAKDG